LGGWVLTLSSLVIGITRACAAQPFYLPVSRKCNGSIIRSQVVAAVLFVSSPGQ
jgi:hypothetical protein